MYKKRNNNLVSIVMPVYNAGEFLVQALESIIAQTYRNWELICVNDASTDKSLSILKKYARRYKRIRVYTNKKNLGIGGTMNRLLKLAKGNFIARMDADDVALPTRIATQVRYLTDNPDISVVGSFMYEIDENNNIKAARKVPLTHEQIKANLFITQTIQNPTLMFVRSRLPEHELYYNGQYSPIDDLDFFFRMIHYGRFANIPEYLMAYRKHSSNSSLKNIKKSFAITWKVRMKALMQYGYSTSIIIKTIGVIQYLTVKLMPNSLLYTLFKIWKRDIVLSSKKFENALFYSATSARAPICSNKKINLSLVVPAFKAESNIRTTVEQLYELLKNETNRFEIIVVVDGIVDSTLNILTSLKRKVPYLKTVSYARNKGKGYAVRAGLKQARYEYVGYIDAGSDITPYSLTCMLDHVRKNPHVDVFFADKTNMFSYTDMVPIYRKIMSRIFLNLTNFILGTSFNDTQAGLKIFKRISLFSVLSQNKFLINRFAFDVELFLKLQSEGYSFKSCPVFITSDIQKSTVKIWDVFLMTKDIFILGLYFRIKQISLTLQTLFKPYFARV